MPTLAIPVSHSAPRSAFCALRDSAARICARHESLGCLLFAVAVTLAAALVERASGATWHAPPHSCCGNYVVEWLLLGLGLGLGALLHAELRMSAPAAPGHSN